MVPEFFKCTKNVPKGCYFSINGTYLHKIICLQNMLHVL